MNGLKNYGFAKEAADLADKTLQPLSTDIAATHTMNDYHSDISPPLSHKGFMDWNLLVLGMIYSLPAL